MNKNDNPLGVSPARQPETKHFLPTTSLAGAIHAFLVVEYGVNPQSVIPLIDSLSLLLNSENTTLTLVHAEYDWVNLHADFADETHDMGAQVAQREIALQEANEAVRKTLLKRGFKVTREMEFGMEGQSLKTLLHSIKEAQQDLLILIQVPPEGELAKTTSFAFTLATHAPGSVLLLRKPIAPEPNGVRIFAGVDASEASLTMVQKLSHYVNLAHSTLNLVTAQSPVYQENAVLAPFVNQGVLDEALESNANMVFEMAADILETQGVTVTACRRLLGSPASELGALAEAEEPDLIAVGSHNRKGVLAWLLGSVSSQLVHWDPHNLLIVR